MTHTLICNCNQTLPLNASALGAALGENLSVHTALCRREAGSFQKAALRSDALVVACTQESRLFTELAAQTEGAPRLHERPIRFVNLRETAGWSREGRAATPKMAALLSAARLPAPDPVPTVTYHSHGRLLVIGPLEAAERAAAWLGNALHITLLGTGGAASQARRWPVLAGRVDRLTGWLGAFELTWTVDNPIDLDLCTRCNACVAACPEGAIGLDYQVDLSRCRAHRACVKACDAAGAIDFTRAARTQTESFDLVLDLRPAPAFSQTTRPQGYVHWNGQDPEALLRLREQVGEFEKPRFVNYRPALCAHARNHQTGCSACVDVCSASAITSDAAHQQIVVNAHLCAGCGTCTSVCPSGALAYTYPGAAHQGQVIKTLLGAYLRAGGRDAALLLHDQEAGQTLLDDLGRAAALDPDTHGLPARVLPLALWHSTSVGLELWLAAVAHGASQVWVLLTGSEAPAYRDALQAQMDVAQALLSGLGYRGSHLRLIEARDARDLAELDRTLQAPPAQGVAQPARFGAQADKRATLELALDHLLAQAPAVPTQALALPPAAPMGTVTVDPARCTLCLSCVGACPPGALLDNPAQPQLRFVEKACVQCGLCARTCPEHAITLQPRWLPTPERRAPRVLHESPPYGCVRCGKPFGTLQGVQAMLERLAGHAMFKGAARERLKMCSDCRVIDLYSSSTETRIQDL